MQTTVRAYRSRVLRVLFVLVPASSVFFTASAGLQTQAGFLWVAESNGILNVATDSGQVRFEIPQALGISSLSVNDINGDLWAYGSKRLSHFTRYGQSVLDVETSSSTHGGDPTDMAVDSISGNLWLAIKRDLYRFNLQGQLQQTITLPREVLALGLDRSRSLLWVAMGQELRIYDLEGVVAKAVTLNPKDNVNDLAYDRALDKVWTNLPDRLRRYDESGNAVFERTGDFSGAIAPDGTGGLWLARNREVIHLDEFGARTFRIEPFADKPEKIVVDLVADPSDASIWVASQKHIKHYAIDGELIGQFTPELGDGVIRRLRRASLYTDLDPPEIEIIAPADGSLLNNNRPIAQLRYFDLGVGVDPNTIKIMVDGQTIAAVCNTGPSSASCIPDSALLDGEHRISAAVADFAGNIADPDEVGITIDTTPPEIPVAQPSQDHITNQAALTIHGSLNEPGTLTINNTPVGLNNSFEFTHEIQLAEGSNVFELAAMDRAGNRSNETLRVALDTMPPAMPDVGRITVGESQAGQASVIGAAGSVEAGSSVKITNLRTGKAVIVNAAADGSFNGLIEAEPGDEITIAAIDRASNTGAAAASLVPAVLGITITEPLDGVTVSSDTVLVAGTLKASLNTAIAVNGKSSTMFSENGGLKFYVSVPVSAGPNILTAVATLQDGKTITKTITVSRAAAAFTANVTPQAGVLPHAVRFSITGDWGFYDQVRFDFNGDGLTDSYGYNSYTYNTAGIYHPKVEIFRYNFRLRKYETIYAQTLTVAVFDPVQLKQHPDQVLRSVWNGMNSALLAGDIPKALTALSPRSRDTYDQIFEALGPRIADVVNESSDIEPIEFSNGIADYAVLNVHGGKSRVFIINFIQGPDGIWRIDSM